MYKEKKTSKEKNFLTGFAVLILVFALVKGAHAQWWWANGYPHWGQRGNIWFYQENNLYMQNIYYYEPPVYHDHPAHRAINRVYRRHFPEYYYTR